MKRKRRKKKMKELAFEQYLELFLNLIPKPEKVDSRTYRGRCPVCGDSKKIRNKKRLYLMKEAGRKPCTIYCHNCGLSMSAYHFFSEHFEEHIEKYKKSLSEKDLADIKAFAEEEYEHHTAFINSVVIEEVNPETHFKMLREEVTRAKSMVGKFFDLCTYSVLENPEAHAYLSNRMIPDKYIREMLLLKPEFHNQAKFRFAYFRDYVMVPFIDRTDGKPYYFHSRRYRNLESRFARYLSCPYRPDDVEVDFFLNELRVDPAKLVIIAEGTIDSLHLQNSIATNGVKKITDEQIERFEYRYGGSENIVYALDNENIDHDAHKKAKELLKKGKRVFLWSLMAKDNPSVANVKDFNRLCCMAQKKKFPTEVIEKYSASNPAALL